MTLKYKSSFVIKMEREVAKYNSVLNAQRSAKKQSESKPTYREPISPRYMTLAKEMELPSYDVDVLLGEIIDRPNSVIATELKKIFMLAKLYYPEASLKIQQANSQAKEHYEAALRRVEQAKIDYADLTVKLEQFSTIIEFKEFKENWQEVLDQLYESCVAVDFEIDKLDFESKVLAETIASRSKFFNIQARKIVADWNHIRENLKIEHIRSIIREFGQDYDSRLIKRMQVELREALVESFAEENIIFEAVE